jgi:hypothetical protein
MSAGGDTKNVHGLKKLEANATRSRGTDATLTLSLLTQRMFLPDNNKIWLRGKKMWGQAGNSDQVKQTTGGKRRRI